MEDTGTDKTLEDARELDKIMRQLPAEDIKIIMVYASALHDRSLLAKTENETEPKLA